jgi:hypothetical protein
MKHSLPPPDNHQELRDALRALCGQFDSNYWQQVDEARGYPEAFVNALTEAGWLAALIPSAFGGSGLGLRQGTLRPFSQRPMNPCRIRSSYESRQTAITPSDTPASLSHHGPSQFCTHT